VCPYCKQPIVESRAGVRLPPIKAAIFDAIKAAGPCGITSRGVLSSVYEARAKPSKNAVKSHVWQINEALENTDLIIKSSAGHWRLTQR
jgi:hypothetical protein